MVTGAGYTSPKEVQQRTLARIYGGQDVIVVGPEGSGKTTTCVLSVLNKFNFQPEGIPLVLMLVPTKEHVLTTIEQLERLRSNKQISIVGLYAAPGTESQMDALADGADIVVATPDRARAIYLKLGLNLNKIELLVIDDADLIVKQGLQLPVAELSNSITKCQRLVFTEVMHDRLHKMIDPFMQNATTVEVDEEAAEIQIGTLPQLLYHVPNFITKLNLLTLFMRDSEVFTKTVVFVNTRPTAEKIYKTLQNRQNSAVAVLNSWSVELNKLDTMAGFKASANTRVLIVCGGKINADELQDIPFLINFELPEDKEIFIARVTADGETEDATFAITFATDLELNAVRRIEQAIGQKLPIGDLPEDLVIEADKKPVEEKKAANHKTVAPVAGEAFHQKKPENAKTYNYSSGEKAKMNKRKKHGG